MSTSFLDDLDAYASVGVNAIEVWLTKLETALADHPPGEIQKRVAEKNLTLAAASYQGGLLLSQGEARGAHFDHFKRRLDLCQQFGIGIMLLAADFAHEATPTDLQRSVASLTQAAHWAAGFDVRLALEFRGADSFCSCLETARLLVEQCGEPNVGVALDVFHYYKGPSKLEDLDRLTRNNLAFVQVCDVAGVPRELMTDSDRIFPGEGDFDLAAILVKLRSMGYDGWVSLELMNPVMWQSKPSQVAELGWSALRRMLDGY